MRGAATGQGDCSTAVMTRLRLASVVVMGAALAGCSTVQHSIVRTTDVAYPPHRGPVAVSVTREPEGGVELAILQVYNSGTIDIEYLVPEMTRTAADLGADFVKIDSIKTRFDEHEEKKTVSRECGTEKEPKTCEDTSTETVYTFTTQLLGRAFRTEP
jgi:hypothetical protein